MLNFEKEVDLDKYKTVGDSVPEETPPEETPPVDDETPSEETPPVSDETPPEETHPVSDETSPEETPPEETPSEEEPKEEDLEEGVVDLNKKKEGDDDEGKKDEDKKEIASFVKIGDKEIPVDAVVDELVRLKSIEDAIVNDEFLLGFIKNYESGGDPLEFVSMVRTDYESMDDMALIRHEFDRENSDIDPAIREKMFAAEMKQKFGYDVNTNEFVEDFDLDADVLKAKLMREAKRLKAKRIEEQKKYKTDKIKGGVRPSGPSYTEILEKRRESINKHQHTKEITESGLIPVNAGDLKFGIKVEDPKSVVEMATDTKKFIEQFGIKEDGVVSDADLMRFYKVIAMAQDPEGYEKKLISIGKTLERRDRMKEAKNLVKPPDGRDRPLEQKENPKRELLKAFAEKGEHFVI